MFIIGTIIDYTFADFFFIKHELVSAVTDEAVILIADNGEVYTIQKIDITEVVIVQEV